MNLITVSFQENVRLEFRRYFGHNSISFRWLIIVPNLNLSFIPNLLILSFLLISNIFLEMNKILNIFFFFWNRYYPFSFHYSVLIDKNKGKNHQNGMILSMIFDIVMEFWIKRQFFPHRSIKLVRNCWQFVWFVNLEKHN